MSFLVLYKNHIFWKNYSNNLDLYSRDRIRRYSSRPRNIPHVWCVGLFSKNLPFENHKYKAPRILTGNYSLCIGTFSQPHAVG